MAGSSRVFELPLEDYPSTDCSFGSTVEILRHCRDLPGDAGEFRHGPNLSPERPVGALEGWLGQLSSDTTPERDRHLRLVHFDHQQSPLAFTARGLRAGCSPESFLNLKGIVPLSGILADGCCRSSPRAHQSWLDLVTPDALLVPVQV